MGRREREAVKASSDRSWNAKYKSDSRVYAFDFIARGGRHCWLIKMFNE